MRIQHERVLGQENAPTPEQLFTLSNVCVALAKYYEKFRPTRKRPVSPFDRRVHFMMPLSEIALSDVSLGERFASLEDRTAARIARTGYSSWSMRLFRTLYVTDISEQPGVSRQVYSFEWDRTVTHMAERRIEILPTTTYGLDDLIEHLNVPDDIGLEFDVKSQMIEVQTGDVALLVAEIAALNPANR